MDVERVEVLRGPQGSLIGANAMGGAVRVISAEPDSMATLYKGEFNLGSTAHGDTSYGGKFVANQPIGEGSAIRVALAVLIRTQRVVDGGALVHLHH